MSPTDALSEPSPAVTLEAQQNSLRPALQQNFLFRDLSDLELDQLESQLQLQSYPASATIVSEGEPAESLFLVVEGAVNVVKSNGQFLAMLGPQGFFGEMGLFTEGARRTANCVAARPTVCAVVKKDLLHRFCDEHTQVGLKIHRAIIRALAERLQATSADLAMLMGTRIKPQADVASIVEKAKAQREAAKKPAGG